MIRMLSYLLLLGLVATLTGCDDMHDQVSIKPQEAPRRTAPLEAIPIQGEQTTSWQSQPANSVPSDDASILRGTELYQINCALCHGSREVYPGAVGKKLVPPPPNLYDSRFRAMSDGDLYKRISLGFGRMPAFQDKLSEPDRWHLVNYLRTFN